MPSCRTCGAWIVFAETTHGKRIPLEPVTEGGALRGNVLLQGHLDGGEPTAVIVEPGRGTHISHFATCPDAPQWRRK